MRVGGDVHAGHVGQVEAQVLGQLDRVPLVGEEHVRAVEVVRAVQADHQGAAVVAAAGVLVEVEAAPRVVRLPGLHAGLEHDLPRAGRRPDGDRHVPLAAGGGDELEQVSPGRPVVGGNLEHRIPVGRDGVGGAGDGERVLLRAAELPRPPDLPAAESLVPAEPVGVHPELVRRRRHVQREPLALGHARLARVPHDLVRGAQVMDHPVLGAGPRVLRDGFGAPRPGGFRDRVAGAD